LGRRTVVKNLRLGKRDPGDERWAKGVSRKKMQHPKREKRIKKRAEKPEKKKGVRMQQTIYQNRKKSFETKTTGVLIVIPLKGRKKKQGCVTERGLVAAKIEKSCTVVRKNRKKMEKKVEKLCVKPKGLKNTWDLKSGMKGISEALEGGIRKRGLLPEATRKKEKKTFDKAKKGASKSGERGGSLDKIDRGGKKNSLLARIRNTGGSGLGGQIKKACTFGAKWNFLQTTAWESDVQDIF